MYEGVFPNVYYVSTCKFMALTQSSLPSVIITTNFYNIIQRAFTYNPLDSIRIEILNAYKIA